MSQYSLQHYVDKITNTKKEAAKSLLILANIDSDFNGDNGMEYLWEDAEGFESNAEYCLSISENESTPRMMIEKFISLWMGRDSYYDDYNLEILAHEDVLFISLAYLIRI